MLLKKGRQMVVIPPLGQRLHNQFELLYSKDENAAVRFVDRMPGKMRLALRNYWVNHYHIKYFDMFFNR